MKPPVPLVAAISIAVLLCIGLAYLGIRSSGAAGEINALKGSNAQLAAQVAAMQKSVDGLALKAKENDAAIGAQGTLQILARQLGSGEMELSLKSLKIVSAGKTLVSVGASPDRGGVIEVKSNDGASVAQISALQGASSIWFRSASGPDAAAIVHMASYGDEGYYLQKGPSDDPAARTDGAGMRIADSGANFFMTQSGVGYLTMDTASADERAKISVSIDGTPKREIGLSSGTDEAGPFVSLAGALSGDSMKLLPDRLSFSSHGGSILLAAAADENGGFMFVNDAAGARRALMTAGAEGHGSISVYGNDKRSNTLYPEYNIQQAGSTEK